MDSNGLFSLYLRTHSSNACFEKKQGEKEEERRKRRRKKEKKKKKEEKGEKKYAYKRATLYPEHVIRITTVFLGEM